jgi:hypothetical protein
MYGIRRLPLLSRDELRGAERSTSIDRLLPHKIAVFTGVRIADTFSSALQLDFRAFFWRPVYSSINALSKIDFEIKGGVIRPPETPSMFFGHCRLP